MKKIIMYVYCYILMVSCNRVEHLHELGGSNNDELQKVLETYTDSITLKQKSAKFIVNNMAGHHYYSSQAIDNYTDFALNETPPSSMKLKERWDSLSRQNHPRMIFDANVLSCKFICDNTTVHENPLTI